MGVRRDAVLAWATLQIDRIGDAAFARLFSDHVALPGIAPAEYAHRRLSCRHGALVGGIRFHGRDVARPFVEVVLHSFDDHFALAQAVAAEWRAFAPGALRLRRAPGAARPAGAWLDQGIHLARYRDMGSAAGQVRLDRFAQVGQAARLAAARYEEVGRDDPELRRNLTAPGPADLRRLQQGGRLRAIRDGGAVAGLIAAAPGAVDWIQGDVIEAEIVASGQTGRGLAAAAQAALAAEAVTAGRGDVLLIGAIDRRNHASRRTAERAGRPGLLELVFVPLPAPDQASPPPSKWSGSAG